MRMQIKNARLSYPSIFKKAVFQGEQTKYEATFIIPKDDPQVESIQKELKRLIEESKMKFGADKICFKDGDLTDVEAYQGCWTLKAASDNRPIVLDRDKTPLTAEDQKIYAGCHVNGIFEFWIQNNSYGKRVNANLYGVQFAKDGEPLSAGGPVDVTDDFADLDI